MSESDANAESVNKNVRVPREALAEFEKTCDASGIENISEFVRRTMIAFVEQSKHGQVRWPPVFMMLPPIIDDELYGKKADTPPESDVKEK